MVNEIEIKYRQTQEYQYLVEHCQAILATRIANSRREAILAYAEIGGEIVENPLYKKFGHGNQNFLERVFTDIPIGKANGYAAIAFYEKFIQGKYAEVSTGVETLIKDFFKEGENISWNKIRLEYLPAPKEDPPELPEGKFAVIYADPPWKFDNSGLKESAQSYYDVMSTDEISAIPVKGVTAPSSVLFLWGTNSMLLDALKVCEAWGFSYKTNMAWIKNKGPSIGWFTVSRHELLLVCTNRDNLHPLIKPISWFKEEVREHSRKPDSIYETIESMYKGPYVELFARSPMKRKGWAYWGKEVESEIVMAKGEYEVN